MTAEEEKTDTLEEARALLGPLYDGVPPEVLDNLYEYTMAWAKHDEWYASADVHTRRRWRAREVAAGARLLWSTR